MAKIENVQFIIPVPGQSYTDIRPVISGEDWKDIRQTAQELAYGVGNKKMGDLLSGKEERHTEPLTSLQTMGDGVLFNKDAHTYQKDGNEYISGSTFAHKFEAEFPREYIAKKVAEKDSRTVEDVLEGWNSKGEISLQYGTLIHKCMETYIKYGEMPNNEYLKGIVTDWADQTSYENCESELFVQNDARRMCGIVDLLVKDKKTSLIDFKTGDIYQKMKLNSHKDDWNQDRFQLYTLQLNFYKYILEQSGTKVDEMIIWWLNGDVWEKVEVPKMDNFVSVLEEVWNPSK